MINTNINSIRVGAQPVKRIYKGSQILAGLDFPTLPNMLFYNGRSIDHGTFAIPSPLSEEVVITSSESINLVCGTTTDSTSSNFIYASIGVYVNGVYNQTIQFTTTDIGQIVTKTIALPVGSQKRVKFVTGVSEGLTNNLIDVTGQFINSITANDGKLLHFVQPSYKAKRYLARWDSIGCGVGTTRPEVNGHIMIMRPDARLSDWSIAYFGFASDATPKTWDTPAKRAAEIQAIVAYFAGATKKVIEIQIGTNNYGGSYSTSVADFTAQYGAFIDELHAADPQIEMKLQTPFVRTDKTAANNQGATLAQIQQAVRDMATARPSFCTLWEGFNIATQNTLAADKVHFLDAGNQQMAESITRYLTNTYPAPISFVGQYAKFTNTAGSSIKITSATLNPAGRTNFSITARVRLKSINSATTDWFLGFGDVNASGSILAFGFNATTKLFRVNLQVSGNVILSAQTFVNTNFMHYEIRRVGMLITVLQEGWPIGSFTLPAELSTNSNIYFGANVVGSTFNYGVVDMDNVRFYNRALTDAENLADRNTDNLTNFTNVLAAYTFDGNANDVTGNGNNGVVGAAVTFPTS